jgi:hypothetical protein
MEQIDSVLISLTGYRLEYFAFVSVVMLIGWYFSQNAKNTIPRLLFVIVGIYLLTDDLYVYRYLGLGFILAQGFFIVRYIKYQYMIFRDSVNIFL